MTQNQRRYARVKPKAMSSRVRVGGVLHLGLPVENLSLGGAFIRCAQAPPLHTHATLELGVPGVNQPLMLSGKVAFVVSGPDAAKRKVSPGFAIEFVRPLPPHVQKGLEHLLRGVDANALVPPPRDEPVSASASARTQSVPAFEPPGDAAELAALRMKVAAHERELDRLQRENAQLRTLVRQLKAR